MNDSNLTFQEYLRENIVIGEIDLVLRARILGSSAITFYIHPQNKDGETRDYLVYGDQLQLCGVANPQAIEEGAE